MSSKTSERIRALVCMAMLCALAVAADIFLRIPNIGGFLTYEPKEVILTIGGFIFGPIAGIAMSLIVCFIEMITVSNSGVIGLLMNFLASGVFIGVSTVIYSRKKTQRRAIVGLIAGSLSMLAIMLLWNYIITPLYTGLPREAVLGMFLPLLIPFNLLKAALNSALILFLYKGVVTALRKSRLIPTRESNDIGNKKATTALLITVSALLTVTLVLVMLIFAGIISF